MCQVDLHNMCCNEKARYNHINLPQFFVEESCDDLNIIWWENPMNNLKNANLSYYNQNYNMHKIRKDIGFYIMVTHEACE